MVVARGGFTLVELLLVLGILATLAAVSLPAIVRWQQRASLEQAASSVQLQMQTARASAVRSGIDWQICFTTNRQQQVVCRLEAIHSHGVESASPRGKRQAGNQRQPVGVDRFTSQPANFASLPANDVTALSRPVVLPEGIQLFAVTTAPTTAKPESVADTIRIPLRADGTTEQRLLCLKNARDNQLYLQIHRLTGTVSVLDQPPKSTLAAGQKNARNR